MSHKLETVKFAALRIFSAWAGNSEVVNFSNTVAMACGHRSIRGLGQQRLMYANLQLVYHVDAVCIQPYKPISLVGVSLMLMLCMVLFKKSLKHHRNAMEGATLWLPKIHCAFCTRVLYQWSLFCPNTHDTTSYVCFLCMYTTLSVRSSQSICPWGTTVALPLLLIYDHDDWDICATNNSHSLQIAFWPSMIQKHQKHCKSHDSFIPRLVIRCHGPTWPCCSNLNCVLQEELLVEIEEAGRSTLIVTET